MMDSISTTLPEESSGGNADLILLDSVETRVLGVLAEKEALTPDNYPLSLNALTAGCNQLTSREPVMKLTEADVQDALDRLIQRKLAGEIRQAGARVVKYEHRMRIQWTLEQDKLAALAVLMLRGPQTAAEIRSRSGRMHDFADVAEAESALQFLIDKYPPLAQKRPRAAGTKESRYVHTFSGVQEGEIADTVSSGQSSHHSDQDRLGRMENEIEHLRAELQQLKAELIEFRKQFD